jgi:hypothetical protein
VTRRQRRKPKGAWDDPRATKAERQAEYEAFHRTQEGYVVRPVRTNKGRDVWVAWVMPRFDALGRERSGDEVGRKPPFFTTARQAVQALRKREGRPDLPEWSYIDRDAFKGKLKAKHFSATPVQSGVFEGNPSEHMLQLVANGWEEGQVERLIHRAAQLYSFGMTRLEVAEQLADEGISREDAALAAAAGEVYARHEFEEQRDED